MAKKSAAASTMAASLSTASLTAARHLSPPSLVESIPYYAVEAINTSWAAALRLGLPLSAPVVSRLLVVLTMHPSLVHIAHELRLFRVSPLWDDAVAAQWELYERQSVRTPGTNVSLAEASFASSGSEAESLSESPTSSMSESLSESLSVFPASSVSVSSASSGSEAESLTESHSEFPVSSASSVDSTSSTSSSSSSDAAEASEISESSDAPLSGDALDAVPGQDSASGHLQAGLRSLLNAVRRCEEPPT